MCPDRVLVGFTAPGLLTEYAAVPAEFAWPVPGHWTDGDAVCAEPLTVALAAIRRSGVRPDGNCLVIGAGSQGGLLCLALVARGITPHVLEPNNGRLAACRIARRQGGRTRRRGFSHDFRDVRGGGGPGRGDQPGRAGAT